jgi:hypothetical protein
MACRTPIEPNARNQWQPLANGPRHRRTGFFATGALPEPLRLENPTTVVQGDRVTHLVYDVSR